MQSLPNKGATGQPSQYYVKGETLPKIFLYITPDLNTYTHLKYYSINRVEDAGAYTNQADVAYRFLPRMCAGLAYYLAMKKAPSLVQQNKLIYEDELKRALDEDGQRASTFIAPQNFLSIGKLIWENTQQVSRSQAISDRSGQAFPYNEMVKEWNGSLGSYI